MQNAQNKKLQKCYKRITKKLQKSNKKSYNSVTKWGVSGITKRLQSDDNLVTKSYKRVT